jgi:hypothetical protein
LSVLKIKKKYGKQNKKNHSYRVFVFKRVNDFNGYKLNDDGSIIYDINKEGFTDTLELTFESFYAEESNSEAYNLMKTVFDNGDVLQITCEIDDNGVFTKRIEKVMDKDFCESTLKSWNSIKSNWFRPVEPTKRIEDHISTLKKKS